MKHSAGDLEMRDISIAFPGVQALTNVSFTAAGGSVHALIGANGAGKSTLMKVLAGAYDHYVGEILMEGVPVHIRTPRAAKDLGIQIVYQEVDTALVSYLSVGENIMLDQTVHGMGRRQFIRWGKLHEAASAVLRRLRVQIPTRKLVSELTLAEKQMVLIARAVAVDCRYLILDEPTAPLSSSETERLFALVRQLREEGVGIIFISHRLPELYDICDEITVMRDGREVARGRLNEMDQATVVQHMLGQRLEQQFPERISAPGKTVLEVQGLSDGMMLQDIRMHLRQGEVVGLAGLVGAGKTELCRALFGASPGSVSEVVLNGRKLRLRSPHQAAKQGLALIPEERRREGIFVHEPVRTNLTAAALARFTRALGWLSPAKERAASTAMISSLGIKTPGDRTLVRHLSGGNQQKVAIGKWLLADSEVYLFDEPTKGVDVGAKKDIFELIAGLAGRGKSILYASSELSEIIGITDRIYVMYDGRIVRELVTAETDEEELMVYCTGGGQP
ncbi:sugar ABC transporter ATP-binding protein [Paenibacillus sp. 1P07SE]|uniref:sugar ABC transporter ATP-binding protein n=1 Tax=Paenibacillus sp. 1P07SE TaxID=3132209 RepID=UPI0039A60133